jgi:hypothetical protein
VPSGTHCWPCCACTADPALRQRLLEQASDTQLAELTDQGVITAADVPAILRTHRPTPASSLYQESRPYIR